jgi:N utilization substance protein B
MNNPYDMHQNDEPCANHPEDQECSTPECTLEPVGPISVKNLSARDMRGLIFHLLYAVDAHEYETPLQTIVDNLNRGFDLDIPFDHKSVNTVREVVQHRDELDASYVPFLKNWRIERVGIATKLVLRYAMWELLHTDTDTRIIINEAVELAKAFAEEDSHRFINGILDRAARALRHETSDMSDDTASAD